MVTRGEAIGVPEPAVAIGGARQPGAAPGPGLGPSKFRRAVRVADQQLDRAVGEALREAPVEPRPGEAGIVSYNFV